MSAINNGGPAFAAQEFIVGYDEKPPVMAGKFYPGMTLRDYAAIKAMQALIPAFADLTASDNGFAEGPAARVAKRAYMLADAMLKARQS